MYITHTCRSRPGDDVTNGGWRDEDGNTYCQPSMADFGRGAQLQMSTISVWPGVRFFNYWVFVQLDHLADALGPTLAFSCGQRFLLSV